MARKKRTEAEIAAEAAHLDKYRQWSTLVMMTRYNLRDSLEKALPTLLVPSSLETCLEAAREFTKEHKHLTDSLKDKRQEMVQQCKQLWNDQRSFSQAETYLECIGYHDEAMLQIYLQKMLEGQDKAVTIEVLAECNPALDNLSLESAKSERPVVTLHEQRAIPSDGHTTTISDEIINTIYGHCDLESAVNLRQVSSSWYRGYNDAETTLKSKLNERCPWFLPSATLSTWADCALVFVSRLKSGKWKPFNTIEDAYIGKIPIPAFQNVVPLELKENEKMPANFEPLDNYNDTFSVDLKILEVNDERYFVRVDNETERVVDYKDMTFTLPPGTKFTYHGYAVGPLKQYIQVSAHHSDFAFSLDKPLHHDYAIKHRREHDIGHFFYTSHLPDHRSAYDQRCYIFFRDFYTDKLIQYGSLTEATPAATHNGLIWWRRSVPLEMSYSGNIRNMIPSFMDLQTPEKVYVRQDRIDPEPDRGGNHWKECQNTRFMTKQNDSGDKQGTFLLDLETRIVTLMQSPYMSLDPTVKLELNYPDKKPTIFAGHVNGKFQAVYLDYKTVKKYEDKKMESDNSLPWDKGVPKEVMDERGAV